MISVMMNDLMDFVVVVENNVQSLVLLMVIDFVLMDLISAYFVIDLLMMVLLYVMMNVLDVVQYKLNDVLD
jgi:hypothetical protein